MTHRVVTTRQADEDIRSAVAYYIATGASDAALRFVDALETAHSTIADYPGIGSTQAESASGVPGLRSIAIEGFPHSAYYLTEDGVLRIVRVLHHARDIDEAMR